MYDLWRLRFERKIEIPQAICNIGNYMWKLLIK